ncbi:MAG: PEGA domain-containing protein [Calditrichaeota bacterium]|nr:MAG: PEGA domain-containing protein [Calditrichota bacterium]
MKSLLWSLLIGGLLALPLKAQRALLSIQSEPAGCWVRIDTVLVGQTPILSLETSPGRHIINVYPPEGGLWNWNEQTVEVTLAPAQDTTVTVVFDQPVLVNSLPPRAEVYAGKQYLGTTPLYLNFARYAGQNLTVRKDGYKPYAFQLVKPGPIVAHLESRFGTGDDKGVTRPKLLGLLPRTHVRAKFALLAATVATHWASFYFKNKADDNFENYQRSGDPARMRHYLNQTRKYDTLSEIALGLSYTSLAGLMYMVIFQ